MLAKGWDLKMSMRQKYKETNEKIRLGYELIRKEKTIDACDVWLEAWEEIKEILAEKKLKNIEILDKKYIWYEYITNFIQDLEAKLGNVGHTKEEYLEKRIKYCQEMLEVLSRKSELTIENTKRAMADSYYALGDKEKCDRLYADWLSEDPYWGWGYIGWSDCYGFGKNKIKPDHRRAEEIIRIALEKKDVRDREDVLQRAALVYNELGQTEKVKELEKEIESLKRPSGTLSKSVKIGRNAPCPCGSGKKYKKCCGQN